MTADHQPDILASEPSHPIMRVLAGLRRYRLVVVAGVLAVALGCVVLTAALNHRDGGSNGLKADWQTIPNGPFTVGPRPLVVPLGDGFAVIPSRAGMSELATTGTTPRPVAAHFNPVTRVWSKMPPVPGDALPEAAVWTGSELLLLSRGNDDRLALAAVRTHPARWVDLAPPPVATGTAATLTWTGDRLLLWGGVDHRPAEPVQFASYRPSTASWTVHEPGPLSPRQFHTATWSGSEMLVVGGSNLVGPDYNDGAAYDPQTDTWRVLPAMLTGRSGHRAAWTDRGLLVVGGTAEGREAELLAAAAETWEPIGGLPSSVQPAADVVVLNDEPVVFPTSPDDDIIGYQLRKGAAAFEGISQPEAPRCGAGVGSSLSSILVVAGRDCDGEDSPWRANGLTLSGLPASSSRS